MARGQSGQLGGAYVHTHAKSVRSLRAPMPDKIRGNYTELQQIAINHDAPDTAETPLRTPIESVNPILLEIFVFTRMGNIFFFP